MFRIILGVTLGIVLAGVIAFAGRMLFIGTIFKGLSDALSNTNQIKPANHFLPNSDFINFEAAKNFADLERERREEEKRIKLAKIAAEEEKARKDAKFKAFYKKPGQCYGNMTKNANNGCVHDYIEAKAAFEALYKEGKI